MGSTPDERAALGPYANSAVEEASTYFDAAKSSQDAAERAGRIGGGRRGGPTAADHSRNAVFNAGQSVFFADRHVSAFNEILASDFTDGVQRIPINEQGLDLKITLPDGKPVYLSSLEILEVAGLPFGTEVTPSLVKQHIEKAKALALAQRARSAEILAKNGVQVPPPPSEVRPGGRTVRATPGAPAAPAKAANIDGAAAQEAPASGFFDDWGDLNDEGPATPEVKKPPQTAGSDSKRSDLNGDAPPSGGGARVPPRVEVVTSPEAAGMPDWGTGMPHDWGAGGHVLPPEPPAAPKAAIEARMQSRKPDPLRPKMPEVAANQDRRFLGFIEERESSGRPAPCSGDCDAQRVAANEHWNRNVKSGESVPRGTVTKTDGGMSTDVYRVHTDGQDRYFRVADEANGEAARKTLAASVVSHDVLGVDLAVKSRLATLGKEVSADSKASPRTKSEISGLQGKVGVLSEAAPGREFSSGMVNTGDVNPSSVKDLEAFEFLVGQDDGHAGNYRVDSDGRIRGYDYDKAFVENHFPDAADSHLYPFGKKVPDSLTPEFKKALGPATPEGAKQFESNLRAKLKAQGAELSEGEIRGILDRRKILLRDSAPAPEPARSVASGATATGHAPVDTPFQRQVGQLRGEVSSAVSDYRAVLERSKAERAAGRPGLPVDEIQNAQKKTMEAVQALLNAHQVKSQLGQVDGEWRLTIEPEKNRSVERSPEMRKSRIAHLGKIARSLEERGIADGLVIRGSELANGTASFNGNESLQSMPIAGFTAQADAHLTFQEILAHETVHGRVNRRVQSVAQQLRIEMSPGRGDELILSGKGKVRVEEVSSDGTRYRLRHLASGNEEWMSRSQFINTDRQGLPKVGAEESGRGRYPPAFFNSAPEQGLRDPGLKSVYGNGSYSDEVVAYSREVGLLSHEVDKATDPARAAALAQLMGTRADHALDFIQAHRKLLDEAMSMDLSKPGVVARVNGPTQNGLDYVVQLPSGGSIMVNSLDIGWDRSGVLNLVKDHNSIKKRLGELQSEMAKQEQEVLRLAGRAREKVFAKAVTLPQGPERTEIFMRSFEIPMRPGVDGVRLWDPASGKWNHLVYEGMDEQGMRFRDLSDPNRGGVKRLDRGALQGGTRDGYMVPAKPLETPVRPPGEVVPIRPQPIIPIKAAPRASYRDAAAAPAGRPIPQTVAPEKSGVAAPAAAPTEFGKRTRLLRGAYEAHAQEYQKLHAQDQASRAAGGPGVPPEKLLEAQKRAVESGRRVLLNYKVQSKLVFVKGEWRLQILPEKNKSVERLPEMRRDPISNLGKVSRSLQERGLGTGLILRGSEIATGGATFNGFTGEQSIAGIALGLDGDGGFIRQMVLKHETAHAAVAADAAGLAEGFRVVNHPKPGDWLEVGTGAQARKVQVKAVDPGTGRVTWADAQGRLESLDRRQFESTDRKAIPSRSAPDSAPGRYPPMFFEANADYNVEDPIAAAVYRDGTYSDEVKAWGSEMSGLSHRLAKAKDPDAMATVTAYLSGRAGVFLDIARYQREMVDQALQMDLTQPGAVVRLKPPSVNGIDSAVVLPDGRRLHFNSLDIGWDTKGQLNVLKDPNSIKSRLQELRAKMDATETEVRSTVAKARSKVLDEAKTLPAGADRDHLVRNLMALPMQEGVDGIVVRDPSTGKPVRYVYDSKLGDTFRFKDPRDPTGKKVLRFTQEELTSGYDRRELIPSKPLARSESAAPKPVAEPLRAAPKPKGSAPKAETPLPNAMSSAVESTGMRAS